MASRLWRLNLIGAAVLSACMLITSPPNLPEQRPFPAASVTRSPSPSPLPSSSPTPTARPEIHLLFTGDINPGRCPAQKALASNDFTVAYRFVAEQLRAADITVVSLDGSLSDLSRPAPCPQTMNLIGPTRTVEGLQFAGVDVVTVAANHAKNCGDLGWDCDSRAFHDTLQTLRQAGIAAVGGGENLAAARAPVILERQGIRFAFLAVSAVGEEMWAEATRPGVAPLTENTLAVVCNDITAARTQAEVVIVLPHWGIEYTLQPDERQRRWGEAMVAAGATLVVGNHPHLIQPLEVLPEGLIAYALGNFIFDQGPWRTRQGVVLETVFRGAHLDRWQLHPVHIYSLYQPRWTDEAETQAIVERVATASAALPPR